MEYLNAIILGVIQGIAEFLPISSSGHLVIASELISELTGETIDADRNMQLNVALHLGTLFSILVVYRTDLLRALRNPRLCAAIVVATIPVVIVGATAYEFVKTELQSSLTAGLGLLLTAALLMLAQRNDSGDATIERMTWVNAVVIGLFQAVAVIPGISRSGSTISGGLFRGLQREEATRFSFLIAIPAIAGAVAKEGLDIFQSGESVNALPALCVGVLVSFAVGLIALRWLIRLVTNRKLHWFSWYCAVVGCLAVAWHFLK